jgi:hypothetical protein
VHSEVKHTNETTSAVFVMRWCVVLSHSLVFKTLHRQGEGFFLFKQMIHSTEELSHILKLVSKAKIKYTLQ